MPAGSSRACVSSDQPHDCGRVGDTAAIIDDVEQLIGGMSCRRDDDVRRAGSAGVLQ
jgi:hypothetical protein